jgi:hypothetical protein
MLCVHSVNPNSHCSIRNQHTPSWWCNHPRRDNPPNSSQSHTLLGFRILYAAGSFCLSLLARVCQAPLSNAGQGRLASAINILLHGGAIIRDGITPQTARSLTPTIFTASAVVLLLVLYYFFVRSISSPSGSRAETLSTDVSEITR